MNPTNESVLDVISDLRWRSARRVRKLVRKAGVKGLPGHPQHCAMAKYIAARTGREVLVQELANVQGESIIGVRPVDVVSTYYLPPGASRFVANFDVGRYPELLDRN